VICGRRLTSIAMDDGVNIDRVTLATPAILGDEILPEYGYTIARTSTLFLVSVYLPMFLIKSKHAEPSVVRQAGERTDLA